MGHGKRMVQGDEVAVQSQEQAVEGGGVGVEGGDIVNEGVGGGDGEKRKMNFLQCFGNNWCTDVSSDLDY